MRQLQYMPSYVPGPLDGEIQYRATKQESEFKRMSKFGQEVLPATVYQCNVCVQLLEQRARERLSVQYAEVLNRVAVDPKVPGVWMIATTSFIQTYASTGML